MFEFENSYSIFGVFHQTRTIAYQGVAPLSPRITAAPGNRHDLPSKFEGEFCGDQASAGSRRLNDEHREGEPADHPVSLWKPRRNGPNSERKLGNRKPSIDDSFHQSDMLRRVYVINSASENSYGFSRGFQRPEMCRRIDPIGHSADYRISHFCDIPGNGESQLAAVGKGFARADDPDIVALNCRMAGELGADMIKLNVPNPKKNSAVPAPYRDFETDQLEAIKRVISTTGGVPVIFAGGEMVSDEDLLAKASLCIRAGGSGFIFGRNIWQRPLDNALTITRSIKEVIRTERPKR